ncbi:MAG TPA: hypothetical protein VFN10_18740 [Thermoanaerobaculia bacterium]|nr:hypothetical protein [Thermoanaerobaculia bacterium]
MSRFIEWNSLDVRVDGAKLNAMVSAQIAGEPMIERVALRFTTGLLRVTGSIRKFISIPFTVEIDRIDARGTHVRVPLARISAGPIPIPTLLVSLVKNRFPRELVTVEEPATLVVSLDRFLPSFVDAAIEQIDIVEGGLAVKLGRGGADLPTGGNNDNELREHDRRV